MGFNFGEYFYTDKYDDKIIIKNNYKSFSVSEIKEITAKEACYLKSLNAQNIIIETEDNFDFIIIFLSCIFAKKNIIISNNNKNLKNDSKASTIISKLEISKETNFKFEKIDFSKINLTIFTSGTTSSPKIVTKSLDSINKESSDTIRILNLTEENKEFIITTPINHMYAITAYIFVPLNSKGAINTDRINYFENINIPNSILISSPSFLSYMQKYNLKPQINPEIILSAGANLKKDTQKYFENFSKVINLYGCTETGFIAYKESSNDTGFKLFGGIDIISASENKTIITSEYSSPEEIVLDDKIIANKDGSIEILGRNDRVFKIQEKRVSAKELEEEILKSEYIKKVCLVDLKNKIGSIAELTEKGVDFIIKNNLPLLIKKIKSDLLKNFLIIPQKWKFIDEIPTNDLGKTDNEKINEIFSSNLSLPLVISKNIGADNAEFEIYFYKNCNFYKGHFENLPITAGVVQLYYAYYFSKTAFGKEAENCHLGQIKRIKFSNVIRPDSIVKLKLTKSNTNIAFEYSFGEISYSSGCFPLNSLKERV